MRRLSSPGHTRQAPSWLWLVFTKLVVCVALNALFMVTQFESDGDVIEQPTLPVIAPMPTP